MNHEPLVSIIIPTYNSETTLEKCLDSIICQTHLNLEIIVVDGGSQDTTKTIFYNYQKKEPRLKIFSSLKGVSIQRNVGIEKMTGEYAFFIDSDDYIGKNCIECLVKTIIKTGCDVVSPNIINVYQKNNDLIEEKPKKTSCDLIVLDKDIIYQKISGYSLATPFKLFKANRLRNYRFISNLNFGEDLLFVVDYASKNRFSYCICNEALYFYFAKKNKIYSYISIICQYFDELDNRLLNEKNLEIKKQIVDFNLGQLRYYTLEYIKKNPFYGFKVKKYRKHLLRYKKNFKRSIVFFLRFPLLYSIAFNIKYRNAQ